MFVAEFIGSPSMNFFNASDLSEAGQTLLKPGADVFGVRPEHFRLWIRRMQSYLHVQILLKTWGNMR